MSAKICTICGLDCAFRARTKDAQGRYVCKDCLDDAAKAKAAAERAKHVKKLQEVEQESDLSEKADNAWVLDMGQKTGVRCPGCGSMNAVEVVVCTNCGFDARIGDRIGTRIKRRKPR